MGIAMASLHVVVILRTQNEYIRTVFDVENEKGGKDGVTPQGMTPRRNKKYLVDPASRDLANEITNEGFKDSIH